MEWMIFTATFGFKTILIEFCKNKKVYLGCHAVLRRGGFEGSRLRAGWDIGENIYVLDIGAFIKENRTDTCEA